ncbi:MAG: replication-associated recombination protein A, partial [Bacilli bacterium]|nr:replication-associated recombination protein A [Bacilli bacterium]
MFDLFSDNENEEVSFKPLAERMRPTCLDDFYGQEEIVGENSPIKRMIETDNISSMILWGPPGVGKTTIAKIIAKSTNSVFYELSATTTGVKEIKELTHSAKINRMNGKRTIVFVDEIHRFNKSQQDTFLPYVENGNIILIGATTENPSFEVNSALLSRTKVFTLSSLSCENLVKILKAALKKFYSDVTIDDDSLELIANINCGDARSTLNTLENIINISKKRKITKDDVLNYSNKKSFIYDKNGEEHYNLISALHKSMRNSDPNAALYYLARMLEAGENPLYIARRLIRFASEDIGLADPNALTQAINAYQASHFIGVPECSVNLAQAVVYLSVTAKSNSLYKAYEKVKVDAIKTNNLKVPLNLRNAVTKLDLEMHYGEGYIYAHDEQDS